ncbi:MAG: EAL domain-containing protein, partial [Granulosicoccaceae bacterium]
DGAYTAKVAEDRDNQFFVETLCSVAHSLGVLAIAEAVEHQEQWDSLRELHVDGVQGFAAGRPEPMDDKA